jgi:LysM repeat protein
MSIEKYVVREGDSLWRIAKTKLGDGSQWPRIWRFNNRRQIIKITGSGIKDPDLIHPNQVLLIPRLPTAGSGQTQNVSPAQKKVGSPHIAGSSTKTTQRPAQSTKPPSSLKDQLREIKSPISIKYRSELRFPSIDTPEAHITMRMTGDVVLMTQKLYPATYVTQKEIETQVVTQANHAYGALVSDSRVIFDPSTKQVTIRNMLVSQSNIPGATSTAVGIQADSSNPIPRLRAEIRLPKLEGKFASFNYVALDVKFVVEITLKPKLPPPGPRAQPLRVPQPGPSFWDYVLGGSLVALGAGVVIGTIIEDFFPVGGGVANDVPSFAAASGLVARGVAMFRTVSALVPAAMPVAQLQFRFSLVLGGAATGQLLPAR